MEERELEDAQEAGIGEEQPRGWADGRTQGQPIFVHLDRGEPVQVAPGSPFIETLEELAEQAHYGGWFRVFVNGSEVINPEDAPATIEPGMRVAIAAYDKVG